MRSQILVPLVALAVAAQACCCCTVLGPQPPYTITPSDEAVRRFEERMDSTETAADGSFTITVTEEEMTSLIVQELAKQEEPLPISDPQVHFRNGRAEFYASVHIAGPLVLPTMVALSITTAGGDIEVGKVSGSARVKTAGGDIELKGASGSVEAKTAGGDIECMAVTGSIDGATAGGDGHRLEGRLEFGRKVGVIVAEDLA